MAITFGSAACAQDSVQYKWLQLVPNSEIGIRAVVRAIVGTGDQCPSLSLAGTEIALQPTQRTKPLLNKGMWINLCGKHEACLLPVGKSGDEKEAKARWLVLWRPNHGYLKADLRSEQARFSMNFYSVAQNQ